MIDYHDFFRIFIFRKDDQMRLYTAVLLLAILTFVGCKKDPGVVTPPERQPSFLHILGAAATPNFDVTFDYWNADNQVITDFFYQRNWPIQGYADMQAAGHQQDEFGNGKLEVVLSRQIFANEAPDTLLPPTEIVLNPEEKSTVCFADSFGNMVLRKFADAYTIPDGATSAIRFINLSPTADTDIASLTTSDNSLNINSVNFLNASDFVNLGDGQYTVEARDNGGNIIATRNMWIDGGIAHTFYLSDSADLAFFKH